MMPSERNWDWFDEEVAAWIATDNPRTRQSAEEIALWWTLGSGPIDLLEAAVTA